MLAIAARLPPGGAIVVRHDALAPGARWRLVRRLVRMARARKLSVWLAGTPALARRWGADGVYLRQRDAAQAARAQRVSLALAMPVHDRREARAARRAGAGLVFISPLFPTRSHPGAPALGLPRWLRLARVGCAKPIALGGLNAKRARQLRRVAKAQGIDPGWAAIDGWQEKAVKRRARQKRNAVPT